MEISRHFIINSLIKKYNLLNPNYLEIGVWGGNTFKHINSINKDGVDDVFPHCKREQEALDLTKSGAQTGDVWKAVYDNFSFLEEISDEILFYKNSERGNLIFKIKKSNDRNIVIDPSIPTKNIDGWYKGNDKEWLKYDYDKDFDSYLKLINKYLV